MLKHISSKDTEI